MKFTARDGIFSALNGLFIGILVPFVFVNVGVSLPISQTLFAVIITLLSVFGVFIGAVLARWFSFFFQLAKFGLVGVTNTVIDFGIFNLFIWVTGVAIGNSIILFKVISVSAAIINSYVWNKFWSFNRPEVDEASARKEFSQFLLVSLFGLLLNTGVASLFINGIGAPGTMDPKLWANVANAIASVSVLAWNFVGYKFFVFKR